MATQAGTKQESVDLQQLAIWTVIAAVVSSIIIVIVFLLTQAQFEGALAMGQAFGIPTFVGATVIQIVLGGVLLGILDRFLSKPITTWMWIAIVVLVLSLAQPFAFLDWTEGVEPFAMTPFILVVMHLIAGGITIYLLTTRTAK